MWMCAWCGGFPEAFSSTAPHIRFLYCPGRYADYPYSRRLEETWSLSVGTRGVAVARSPLVPCRVVLAIARKVITCVLCGGFFLYLSSLPGGPVLFVSRALVVGGGV